MDMLNKHHLKLAAATAAISLLSVTIRFGHPAYQCWRERRASTWAAQYLVQGNDAAASLSARQALRLNSNNIVACRVLAELAERHRSPRELHWRERLCQLEPGNMSNSLALIQAAVQLEQFAKAAVALAGIDTSVKKTNAACQAAAAQLAFAQRDMARAEQHLAAAVQLDPGALAHRYNLEIIRLHSLDTNVVQTARERLEPGRTDPIHGASILRALATEALAHLNLERACQLSRDLQSRPEAGFGDRLLHMTIVVRQMTGQAQKDRAFWAALAGAQSEATADASHTAQLLHWLASHGFAEAGLEWLDQLPEELRRATAVRRAEAECYVVSRKWRELTAVLQLAHWGADEHLRHALLALAWRQTGDETMARIEWKRAVRAGFSAATAVLVRLAGSWEWEKEAEALLWEISREGPDRQWALALLCRAYELSGDTRSLLRVYDVQREENGRDLVAKNNYAAACLLVRTNLGMAHLAAREVFQAQPTNAAFACTFAYSLHLQGQNREALRVFEGLPEEARRAPGVAAYYGLILKSQGAPQDAAKYLALALAHPKQLLPEERGLVEAALRP